MQEREHEQGGVGDSVGVVDGLATHASCLSAMGKVALTAALYGDLPTAPEPEEVLLLVGEWLRHASDELYRLADAVEALARTEGPQLSSPSPHRP